MAQPKPRFDHRHGDRLQVTLTTSGIDYSAANALEVLLLNDSGTPVHTFTQAHTNVLTTQGNGTLEITLDSNIVSPDLTLLWTTIAEPTLDTPSLYSFRVSRQVSSSQDYTWVTTFEFNILNSADPKPLSSSQSLSFSDGSADFDGTIGHAVADGSVTTAKLADNAVTNAKLTEMAANTAKVNATASSADPQDLSFSASTIFARLATGPIVAATVAQIKTLLSYVFSDISGTVSTAQIADEAVTYAKIQHVTATDRFLGRDTTGAGDVEEIAMPAARTMLNVEDGADVTDSVNVAAAGAVMDGDFSTNGVMTRTGASTYASRTVTGTSNEITVADGDGVSGNPTIGLSDNPTIPGTGALTYAGDIDLSDGKSLRDGNNNEWITFRQVASAVNEITIANAATGSGPEFQATGDDDNIDIVFTPKGTGGVGIGTTTPDQKLHVETDDASASSVTQALRLTHTTSGTPTTGIGVGLEFEAETAASNNEVIARIEAVTTDVTATDEDAALDFYTMDGGSISQKMRLSSEGIGIGTSSPQAELHVHSGSTTQTDIYITHSTSGTTFGSDGANITLLNKNLFITNREPAGIIKLQVEATTRLEAKSTGVDITGNLTITGDINPEADGTRNLGTQTTAQWANVWADLVNGADFAYLNGWRTLESDKYEGYSPGFALGADGFESGVVTEKMPPDATPVFVVTQEFIEFQGVRLTADRLRGLLSLEERIKAIEQKL